MRTIQLLAFTFLRLGPRRETEPRRRPSVRPIETLRPSLIAVERRETVRQTRTDKDAAALRLKGP